MPTLTRSSTTVPVKSMAGIKRKFIEIVETDDETSTVESESDSEYEPDIADVLEEEIEELKTDLNETEKSNDALINILIKERETIQKLEIELAESNEKYNKLRNSVKDIQTTAMSEFVCLSMMLVLSGVIALTSVLTCKPFETE